MKVLRSYKIRQGFLICEISCFDDDQLFPSFPTPLVLKARIYSPEQRLKWNVFLSAESGPLDEALLYPFSFVSQEMSRFLQTIKQMYEL